MTDALEHHEGLSTREKINYSLAGVILLGGLVIVGRAIVKKNQANSQERLTYEDGNAATYAKQIKMAFDNDGWWGTNTGLLRDAIREIPSKEMFRQVMDAYQKLYDRTMMRDMADELRSTEYDEVIAIVSAKPERITGNPSSLVTPEMVQGWAKRLKAAFDITYGVFPGTDEPAIKAVFLEIPTQSAFALVGNAYRILYGNDLLNDLKSELEFWEFDPMLKLIYDKPNA